MNIKDEVEGEDEEQVRDLRQAKSWKETQLSGPARLLLIKFSKVDPGAELCLPLVFGLAAESFSVQVGFVTLEGGLSAGEKRLLFAPRLALEMKRKS